MATALREFQSLHQVLIVEDNGPTASMLEFLFSRAGYEVLIAADGRAALELLKSNEPVSLILLDLMLPYVSGYQVLSEARDDVSWCDVPILVLSGKVLEGDVVKALDLGANDYVTKPFRPQELLARSRRLIATHESVERFRA